MRLCADSWFFLELAKENKQAIKIMKDVENGKHTLFVPVLAISEITVKLYQKGNSLLADTMIANLVSLENVVVVDINIDIAKEIAKMKHSLSLSLADASMLATYKMVKSDSFLAVDADYKIAIDQGVVKIKRLEEIK